jgi:hypothetical protein
VSAHAHQFLQAFPALFFCIFTFASSVGALPINHTRTCPSGSTLLVIRKLSLRAASLAV